ncbi:organelle RRM domain-containing protein 2, mitochondrial [Brachypodium distachyon]|nr:organelle RRM domain-containing protein 2, mitochondrial [Brachypodium distachyon]|eukprot:XP_003562947.2 organelle RRM domain-containing protein 2, mitochondrial [Brachypodium distachyon]
MALLGQNPAQFSPSRPNINSEQAQTANPSRRNKRNPLIVAPHSPPSTDPSILMAAVASRAGAARAGFRRMFSVSAFSPPPPPAARPAAEPCNNLFVSGLNKRTTTDGLREAFSKFGQVTEARVITDRISGYSRGFGFVKYATVEEAGEGIKGMDGKFLDGWVIFAEYAKQREAQQPPQSAGTPSGYQYSS